jgi:hypothetical protein
LREVAKEVCGEKPHDDADGAATGLPGGIGMNASGQQSLLAQDLLL